MFETRPHELRAIPLFILFVFLLLSHRAAAASVELGVSNDNTLLYASGALLDEQLQIRKQLKEGSNLAVSWTLSVAEVRRYWLNRAIAEVQFTRRVTPDLVSGKWKLFDSSSGLTRQTHDLDDAVTFLLAIEEFPLLDRSLLDEKERYRLEATLQLHHGEGEAGWIDRWWLDEQYEAALEFSLP